MLMVKISPELCVKVRHKQLFKNEINLKNPKLFSEKIQWLKLYHRDDKIVLCSDKYRVRAYVENLIGKEYLINMPFVWNSYKEINFNMLPKSFVLKPNNSSGSVLICKDKKELNEKKAIRTIKKWQRENIGKYTGEWVYGEIPFKIICEEYLEDEIVDYKFYFGGGEFICIQTISGRQSGHKRFAYYDENWNLLDIKREGILMPESPEEKPKQFEEMLEIAKKLAKGFIFVRVDLYCVKSNIYFGELSFYPNNGLIKYETQKMDDFFSNKIKLPDESTRQ